MNLMIAVLFTATSIFAGNTPSISTDGSKAFILDTELWNSEYVSVTIKNEEGILIWQDKYSTRNDKRFNFENLPNGLYSITLDNELKTMIQEFRITKEEIILGENINTIFKPWINVSEQHIDLNFLANKKKTKVTIYDNNENIFDIVIKGKDTINKRFDISELAAGEYSFHVSSNGNTYTTTFKK